MAVNFGKHKTFFTFKVTNFVKYLLKYQNSSLIYEIINKSINKQVLYLLKPCALKKKLIIFHQPLIMSTKVSNPVKYLTCFESFSDSTNSIIKVISKKNSNHTYEYFKMAKIISRNSKFLALKIKLLYKIVIYIYIYIYIYT